MDEETRKPGAVLPCPSFISLLRKHSDTWHLERKGLVRLKIPVYNLPSQGSWRQGLGHRQEQRDMNGLTLPSGLLDFQSGPPCLQDAIMHRGLGLPTTISN